MNRSRRCRGLDHVRHLILHCPFVKGPGLKHLEGMRRLETLELDGQNYSASQIENIAGLTWLIELNLHGSPLTNSPLTSAGLEHLAKMTRLKKLDLSSTEVDSLEALKGMHDLQELNLSGSAIGDDSLAALADLKKLKTLNLADTSVGDWGIAHFSKLENLEELDLSKTTITDEALSTVAGLKRLKKLHLSETRITDAGFVRLASLPNLKLLIVDGSRVTDSAQDVYRNAHPDVRMFRFGYLCSNAAMLSQWMRLMGREFRHK